MSGNAERDAADDILTTALVARELGCTTDNVRFHERRGHLPALRTVGGQRLFRRADVETFKASRQARRHGVTREA
jgi:excisionase family DNA binding protein